MDIFVYISSSLVSSAICLQNVVMHTLTSGIHSGYIDRLSIGRPTDESTLGSVYSDLLTISDPMLHRFLLISSRLFV